MFATRSIAAALIGLMASCPYVCLGQSPGDGGRLAWRGCQDPCCSSREPCQNAPADDRSGSDQSNCLCHGAVLSGSFETGGRHLASLGMHPAFQRAVDAAPACGSLGAGAVGPLHPWLAGACGPLDAGRDLVIATAALLL